MRFLARFWPWPFGFSPMAGNVTSQPMSKITLRRMLPLEQRYYTKNHADWSDRILERHQDGISTEAVGRAAQAGASVAPSQLVNCADAVGVFRRHAFSAARLSPSRADGRG